jgi:hypothetical protein
MCKPKPMSRLLRPGIACAIPLVSTFLSSCGFVDHFGPRVYDNNLQSQDALNQEALVNIVRASRFQPLNFVAVAQLTGGQSETLTTGLPTVTFGPGQIPSQKQWVFGSNSLGSAATSSFQTSPLQTTAFQQGMISPISAKEVAILLSLFPRESVYYAVLDGIKLTTKTYVYYLRNDPSDDFLDGVTPNDQCKIVAEPKEVDTLTAEIWQPRNDRLCNFSKFVHVLHQAMDWGLSSELMVITSGQNKTAPGPSPNTNPPQTKSGQMSGKATKSNTPGAGGANGGGAATMVCPSASGGGGSGGGGQSGGQQGSTSSCTVGHVCFDPAVALPSVKKLLIQGGVSNICGSNNSSSDYEFPFGSVTAQITMVFRSPEGIYRYLGKLLRDHTNSRVTLSYPDAQPLPREPFLNIIKGTGGTGDCFISVYYDGQSYCVPRAGASNTAMMIDILEQLRNLAISPTDLNAALSVRVVN